VQNASNLLKKAIVTHGNGTGQDTLPRENVAGVDAFVALTRDDGGNLIVLLLPRRLGAKMLVALVNRRD
jgi:trk system potassium uptake protein TrkA